MTVADIFQQIGALRLSDLFPPVITPALLQIAVTGFAAWLLWSAFKSERKGPRR